MSSFHQCIPPSSAVRLAAIASASASLKTQLSELKRLREQVRKTELSA
jgi:hypothetical protein